MKIGVFAPSSYVEKDDIEASQAVLEARGFEVFVHPQTFERFNQSAGTHAAKLDALHALYADPEVDLIWAAGGGNRALHILDGVDFDLIRANPKPMVGFSDVTALLNGIAVRSDVSCYHGPVFKNLHKHRQLDQCLDLLRGEDAPCPLDMAEIVHAGYATGRLFGGNLSVFQYLPQTLPPFTQGAILFLEDCNEELSRIDRIFAHLKRLGVLDEIGGLILGEFLDLQDGGRPFGFTLEDIVREHMEGRNIPIIMNAPFGHGDNNYTLPVGRAVRLDARDENGVSLKL